MLEVKNLRFNYGDQELFNNIDIKINPGEHVGLIGINGVGKSTFMNLIAHRLTPDSGEIVWDKNTTYSYLDQHLLVYDDQTIEEYLYDVYTPLFEQEKRMNQLYESLVAAEESSYDKILNKAYQIQEQLEQANFYMIKSKVGNIIQGLGIDVTEKRKLRELSGGQKAKVFLGKMLLEEKDVLLLDEPTNFLDTHHIDWLAKFLINYKNAFLVISHHSSFLNTICNVILALENKQMIKYKGNMDDYQRQKEQNQDTYRKEYIKQQQFIKKTEEFINKNIVRATTTKRAQSRRKMLDKITVIEKPQSEKKVYFQFDFTKSFHLDSLVVEDLSIGYTYPILEHINLTFEFDKKYVIIGKNGIGKTTFLKTVLDFITPIKGKIRLSKLNDISYFPQEIPLCDATPIDYFREDYPLMEDGAIRVILAKYGISGLLPLKPMTQLSGGEVTKVRFAKMSLTPSNLLILDEPTNHLDRIAKSSLFQAIEKYPGTVILVSHEKYFYKQLQMKEIKF